MPEKEGTFLNSHYKFVIPILKYLSIIDVGYSYETEIKFVMHDTTPALQGTICSDAVSGICAHLHFYLCSKQRFRNLIYQ